MLPLFSGQLQILSRHRILCILFIFLCFLSILIYTIWRPFPSRLRARCASLLDSPNHFRLVLGYFLPTCFYSICLCLCGFKPTRVSLIGFFNFLPNDSAKQNKTKQNRIKLRALHVSVYLRLCGVCSFKKVIGILWSAYLVLEIRLSAYIL